MYFSLNRIVITVGRKMRLFQSVRKYFEIMGIYSPHSNQCNSKWNWKNCVFLISTAELVISSAAFFLYQAKTAVEYGFAFFEAICGFAAMSAIAVCIWKREHFFNLIGNFEDFIEKSEYTDILQLQVEKKNSFNILLLILGRNAKFEKFSRQIY